MKVESDNVERGPLGMFLIGMAYLVVVTAVVCACVAGCATKPPEGGYPDFEYVD